MRPKSIAVFNWLFLASLVLSAINSVVSYSTIGEQFRADPNLAAVATWIEPFFMVSIIMGLGISVLLWFFISRRASEVAKWILVAFTAFGVLGVVQNLRQPMFGNGQMAILACLTALQVAAVYFLFRPDARAWFEGKGPIDPTVFE